MFSFFCTRFPTIRCAAVGTADGSRLLLLSDVEAQRVCHGSTIKGLPTLPINVLPVK